MSIKETGGPAFQQPHVIARYTGMTLRDYFAVKAVVSYLDDIVFNGKDIPPGVEREEFAATQAYMLADAMLKARAE